MSLFAWNEKYSVNIQEIDDQHKRLIGLVSQLHGAMQQGKGKEVMDKILKELIQYTRTHFAAEERIMKVNGYPSTKSTKQNILRWLRRWLISIEIIRMGRPPLLLK